MSSSQQPRSAGHPPLEHLLKGLKTVNPSLAFETHVSLLQLEHLLQGSECHLLKWHRQARWRLLSVSVGRWIPTSTTASWQIQLDEAALTLTNPREFFTSLAVLGPCMPSLLPHAPFKTPSLCANPGRASSHSALLPTTTGHH